MRLSRNLLWVTNACACARAYVDSLIGRSDIVLLDLTSIDSWTRYTLERLTASPDFAVNAISHETIMYSRITHEE